MKIRKVIFSVGIKHPLYEKAVEAEILTENGGYNGKSIYAKAIEPVNFPRDEKGLLVFRDGKLVGFKPREAYTEIWEGYCSFA